MKGRIFRKSLGDLYQKVWALILQFKRDDLVYFTAQDRKVLPAEAMHDDYAIQPDGSPDQWDKEGRLQKAVTRFQLFKGHPNVDQEELAKSVLQEDDPRLVKRLFISTDTKAATEQEDEAMEIMLMLNQHYPATARPEEDHPGRIRLLVQRIMSLQATGVPVDPVGNQLLAGHLQQHLELLKQQNPEMAKQLEEGLQQLQAQQAPQHEARHGVRPPMSMGCCKGGGGSAAGVAGTAAQFAVLSDWNARHPGLSALRWDGEARAVSRQTTRSTRRRRSASTAST